MTETCRDHQSDFEDDRATFGRQMATASNVERWLTESAAQRLRSPAAQTRPTSILLRRLCRHADGGGKQGQSAWMQDPVAMALSSEKYAIKRARQ